MKKYLLGIDIGTTGSKAVLIDTNGKVIAHSTNEYPIIVPKPGWSEQNPIDWWNATIKSIRDVIKTSGIEPGCISGIGLTGQMHGLVLMDKHNKVLRPCILWNDQRTIKECKIITQRIGKERLINIAGKPALTSFTVTKILWVKNNEPEIYNKITHILLPKDYVRYCLTGEYGMDVADASGTCLFDVGNRKWSEEIISILNIKKEWLPAVYESSEICGYVNRDTARATGLKLGIPVVCGAGDQSAQAIGTGIYAPGTVSVTIGTSGVVFAAIDKYQSDKTGRLHTYCHAIPEMWHLMGVMLSAGGSLRWFRDTFYKQELIKARRQKIDIYDLITYEADEVPPGSEDLIFLPYLSGERTPYPDPYARGVFFGLSLKHSRCHMARAVIEGITFGLRDCLELLKDFGIEFERVRVSGGGAKSSLWRRIMADVFNLDVVTVNATQGAAFGAAILTGVGAGIYRDVGSACERIIKETDVTKPNKNVKIYEQYYQQYRKLYPALKEKFKALSDIRADRR